MKHPRGQSAVETALVLPLLIFIILGTVQLFMLFQGRVLAQYAVYKAVRAGSVNQGSCLAMSHAAVATLLPSITRTDSAAVYAQAFSDRKDNRYNDGGHRGQIIELVRDAPAISVPSEEENDRPGVNNRLEVRMIYWFRLKIPFANWVMSRMLLGRYGLLPSTPSNPLAPTQRNPNWSGNAAFKNQLWPGGDLATNMRQWAQSGQYLFPIEVTSAMRMMTPPRSRFFSAPACPLTPDATELP